MFHEIRQRVTDRILKALAEGLVPWGRLWLGHRNDGPATNALTSLPFRGVNPLLLNLADFTSKWWATERCWKVFGYRLKPHQHGVQVFTSQADDLQGETVFNAEQVQGPGVERYLLGDTAKRRLPAFEAAERVIAATEADIRHINGTKAVYYRLPKAYIVLPLKAQFESGPGGLPAYFNTAAHELGHHSEHRLNWLADPHLGFKDRYDIGELRSTLGAAFLTAQISIPFYHNQASHSKYLGTWMKLMKADPTFIFRVTESAWDAAEFILSFSRKPLEVFSPPMKASGNFQATHCLMCAPSPS
jgi:antirestriction protein ArdC